jgi:hypothetical protein
MKPRAPRDVPSIVEFVTDPQLLGLSVSPAQRTLLKSIYGLPSTRRSSISFDSARGATRTPHTISAK